MEGGGAAFSGDLHGDPSSLRYAEIRSTGSPYTSYWNAFLFDVNVITLPNISTKVNLNYIHTLACTYQTK